MSHRFTDRLKVMRQSEKLDSKHGDYFLNILRNIELHGVSITSVGGGDGLGWSYSIGLYDTYGQPEIITSGFPPSLAHSVLNQIGRNYEQGMVLHQDARWAGLLGGGCECVFKTTERKWVDHLMLSTCWFYGDTSFPVMQCICPDLSNKFPWEKGFDKSWRSRQALLFEGAKQTKVEKAAWDSNNRSGTVQ